MTVRDCHIFDRLTKKILSMVNYHYSQEHGFLTSKQIIDPHLFNLHA